MYTLNYVTSMHVKGKGGKPVDFGILGENRPALFYRYANELLRITHKSQVDRAIAEHILADSALGYMQLQYITVQGTQTKGRMS